MSYIEKEKLIKADISNIENCVRHVFNQGYDLGFKDGEKQEESFINKLCVSEKICKHDKNVILDKIRAEIAKIHLIGYATIDGKREIANRAVMHIIDKYKTNIEPQEIEVVRMTNGEKIKEIFPDLEIISEIKDVYVIMLEGHNVWSPKLEVFKSWWNSECKEPSTK